MFSATASNAEPGALTSAGDWVAGLLQGQLALTAAILAVAVVGLLMLTGQTDWRGAIKTTLGIAIVFGAPSLAAGLLNLPETESVSALTSPPPTPPPTSMPATMADPYAGASLPG